MAAVHLEYVDAVFFKVKADRGILMEIYDHFTFMAENYKHDPRFKARAWDGKIRLFNLTNQTLYAGLAKEVKKFCESRGYDFEVDYELVYDDVSLYEVREFLEDLTLPFKIRDYQLHALVKSLRTRRRTLVSPTSSGKTLMIFLLTEWYRNSGLKVLILCTRVGLVTQMLADFHSYNYSGTISASTEEDGSVTELDTDVVVTTWQSICNSRSKPVPTEWLSKFGAVMGDEAHNHKATMLKKILEQTPNTHYRFAFTGTLGDKPLTAATVQGLFGPILTTTTTKKLMDRGYVSKALIKCIILQYNKEDSAAIRDYVKDREAVESYKVEINNLLAWEKRNKFIRNLALSFNENSLILFRRREHGQHLYQTISEVSEHTFYVDGTVKGKKRQETNEQVELVNGAHYIASAGTTAEGVSINNVQHVVVTHPMKGEIKLLQIIGRGLRLDNKTNSVVIYDIVDDLRASNQNPNFCLNHFQNRVQVYEREKFDYEIHRVKI